MRSIERVVVVGLDGMEPRIVEPLLESGKLTHLDRVRRQGTYTRVATTYPAQTPVAWSTFATGLNPGGHGIFDFLRRDPATYLPQPGLTRYEQKNPFVPPQAVNLRRGRAIWEALSVFNVPSSVLRCPCTYPPKPSECRILAGMGVPDLRGSLGTSTYFTTQTDVRAHQSETVVTVTPGEAIITVLSGPTSPQTRRPLEFEITIRPDHEKQIVSVCSAGSPAELVCRYRQWSPWLRVRFRSGLFQAVHGMVRFYLGNLKPQLDLYASPINFDVNAPMFPISSPKDYARELADTLGLYHTTGMAEDHEGLVNGRLDEDAFLDQCEDVYREREAMLLHELGRTDRGFLFCLFDTPDRVQHMFWRFLEPDHPANREHRRGDYAHIIERHYRRCDETVGKVLEGIDERTLLIVLSDHGFTSFRRGVHLNTWLHRQGLLHLKDGRQPGLDAEDLLRQIDWSRTQAYALGLGGIYVNLQGREANGIVRLEDTAKLKYDVARRLCELDDPVVGRRPVRSVADCRSIYRGPASEESPDLLVNFDAGYRASWETALGGVPETCFSDNRRCWAGDHIVDPQLVPGVLFTNRTFKTDNPRLIDLAPTILDAFGHPKEDEMEGESLLA